MVRKLENWIESFAELFGATGAPPMFRTWAAIATVAGVMERRFHVDVGMGPLYPNVFVILVAPPGIGKTELTKEVWSFWDRLSTGNADGLHVAPPSVTAAALIDALKDGERKFFSPESPLEPLRYNAINVCSNELGTLLPVYDPQMMSTLTDLYDNLPYAERRRTKDLQFKIPNPLVNMIAATTPAHLMGALPEGAWDQGFLSRTILIFNSERTIRPLFSAPTKDNALRRDLDNDLRHIFGLSGVFKFSEDAAKAVQAWHMAGGPPAPDHPRLNNYSTRRTAHILKLSMIASMAATDSCTIELEHFQTALNWLVEAEVMMPDIFKAMVHNADMKAMDECWHFAYGIWMKEGQPVAEHRLVAFLQERVPVQNVMRMLQVMEGAKILEKKIGLDAGNAYQPKSRKR